MITDIEKWLGEQPYSANTADRYRRSLVQILEDYDLEHLDVVNFRAWLDRRGWSNATQWVAYNAVKGFIRWKYGDDHPALALKLARKKGPPQRTLRLEQVRKLLYSFNTQTIKGRRDLAMACLFLDSGLRVAEMCALEIRYLDLSLLELSVKTKGGNWGRGAFSPVTASYLATWLADREGLAVGNQAVFVSVGGQTPGRPMTRHGVQRIVRDWGLQSGIGALSPHDFRRGFATISTLLGAPQRLLMAAGRWSSADMIKRYTPDIAATDMLPYSPVMAAMR